MSKTAKGLSSQDKGLNLQVTAGSRDSSFKLIGFTAPQPLSLPLWEQIWEQN